MPTTALLDIRKLYVAFQDTIHPRRLNHVVRDVSLLVQAGEILCLVGESGSGKSVTALSIPQLLPMPPAKITAGSIFFEQQDLVKAESTTLRKVRGARIGMIFQDPMTSLNPVFTVGAQIDEVLLLHTEHSHRTVREKTIELLHKVGIPSPEIRANDYPHHLSGGMRQRVMIAMAIACSPRLIIADEPTTALDATVQRQILALLHSMSKEHQASLLLITHDLSVVAEIADTVAVMYAGEIVEYCAKKDFFADPQHPYSRGLILSRPRLDVQGRHKRLHTIPGTVPSLQQEFLACPFQPRCTLAFDKCHVAPAPSGPHASRCWLAI